MGTSRVRCEGSSWTAEQQEAIRAAVEAIAASPGFASAPRRTALLRYVVERTLAGEGGQLTEYGIALDVLGRPSTFDPRTESAVRTEAARLRQKLAEYYWGEGKEATTVIQLPARSYVAAFEFREAAASSPVAEARRGRRRWLAPAAVAACLVVGVLATRVIGKAPGAAGAPSGAVRVNGVCMVGNCVSPHTLELRESATTKFDFVYTCANTDRYQIAGKFVAANSVAGWSTPYTVTYLGNAQGGPSATDVLTIDLIESFESLSMDRKRRSGTQGLHGSFDGPIAKTSSMGGYFLYDNQPMPMLGPFSPPADFSTQSGAVSLEPLGNPYINAMRRVMTFGAGSGVGAVIRNAIP